MSLFLQQYIIPPNTDNGKNDIRYNKALEPYFYGVDNWFTAKHHAALKKNQNIKKNNVCAIASFHHGW